MPQDSMQAQSLEGFLFQRRKRKLYGWKRRYVVFNLTDGGGVICYRSCPAGSHKDVENTRKGKKSRSSAARTENIYSSLCGPGGSSPAIRKEVSPRRAAVRFEMNDANSSSIVSSSSTAHLGGLNLRLTKLADKIFKSSERPSLHIPADVDWFMQDVENNDKIFRIGVPPSDSAEVDFEGSEGESDRASSSNDVGGFINQANETDEAVNSQIRTDREKNFCYFYFSCPGGGNEKALWLKAARKLNRLSSVSLKLCGNNVFAPVNKVRNVTSRYRTTASAAFAEKGRRAERSLSVTPQCVDPSIFTAAEFAESGLTVGVESAGAKPEQMEYKVFPTYAYPHRWMTHEELCEEMLRPSSEFHDVRVSTKFGDNNEIGTLRVEVLGCLGLPKLDRFSKTDAVCYLVCGSHAFATDVIPGKFNPIWPRHSRRACIFPLYHAYAQLFVGVFDDDGPSENDDFAGRVVIDIARLRPGSTYDVTLPLRLSSYAYTRRRRGSVRLRFRLEWANEQAAVMSYISNTKASQDGAIATHARPVTVQCADRKSFRNIAITVQGVPLPGRYSEKAYRATLREFKLYRVMLKKLTKETVRDIVTWKRPVVSSLVFIGWMHCVYCNSVALLPPYMVSCIFLLLVRNYAKYNINEMSHRGYAPLTVEELFCALTLGGSNNESHYMKPLDLKQSSTLSGTGQRASPEILRSVNDDRPLGQKVFQICGLINDENKEYVMTAEQDHMEFPFSKKEKNPKITVKDSLAARRNPSDEHQLSSQKEITSVVSLSRMMSDYDDEDEDDTLSGRKIDDLSTGQETATHNELLHNDTDLNPQTLYESPLPDDVAEESNLLSMLPEQNADIRIARKKKIKDELMEFKEKAQKMTLRVFDDRIYLSKEVRCSSHFSNANDTGDTEYFGDDVMNDQDKFFGIHAHSNPVTAQKAAYLQPIIEIMKIGLCATRAVFNVFMWKDPYMSFWASLACLLSIGVLVVFPWRLFLFAVGVAAVGPQNWMIRIIKSRAKEGKEGESLIGSAIPDNCDDRGKKNRSKVFKRWKKTTEKHVTSEPMLSEDGSCCFIFRSHLSNGRDGPQAGWKSDPSKILQVVIPYSPLLYNRFYDWPPERAYSTVTMDSSPENHIPSSEASLHRLKTNDRRKNNSFDSEFHSERATLLRKGGFEH